MIAAVSENGVIGRKGSLPWYLPTDFLRFRKLTTNCTILAGMRTAEELPYLKGRHLLAVTRSGLRWFRRAHRMVRCVKSIKEGLQRSAENLRPCWVIGGAELYKAALLHENLEEIHLTIVHGRPEGDTNFPVITGDWAVREMEYIAADARHQYATTYLVLTRRLWWERLWKKRWQCPWA